MFEYELKGVKYYMFRTFAKVRSTTAYVVMAVYEKDEFKDLNNDIREEHTYYFDSIRLMLLIACIVGFFF
jgi:hypothetical protein